MRDLAVGPLPMLLTRVLLRSMKSRDHREEEARRARYLLEVLEDRDRNALAYLRKQTKDKSAIGELKKFLGEDRKKQKQLGKKSPVLDITSEVRSDLHALLGGGLQDVRAEVSHLLKRQEKLEAVAVKARIEYESVPHSDAIAQIATERDTLRKEVAELEAMDGLLGQDIERQERELERRQQVLTRLIEASTEEEGQHDDRIRILQHAGKVRATLGAFRRAVTERHIRRIEQLVLESYQQLLRKSALVTRLAIDPETFCLTLFDRDGEIFGAERLSAGERQLLAIALLWGLAKASGRPPANGD